MWTETHSVTWKNFKNKQWESSCPMNVAGKWHAFGPWKDIIMSIWLPQTNTVYHMEVFIETCFQKLLSNNKNKLF